MSSTCRAGSMCDNCEDGRQEGGPSSPEFMTVPSASPSQISRPNTPQTSWTVKHAQYPLKIKESEWQAPNGAMRWLRQQNSHWASHSMQIAPQKGTNGSRNVAHEAMKPEVPIQPIYTRNTPTKFNTHHPHIECSHQDTKRHGCAAQSPMVFSC